MQTPPEADLVRPRPSGSEFLRTFGYIGVNSFGGPAGQIAVMHRVLVDEKKWITEGRFLHALNFCMLLPGPEAMQLATYAGWLLRGRWGGLLAGLLFVLPGAAMMLLVSMIYVQYHAMPAFDAAFFGLKAAVLAIVVEALLRIGKRALKGRFAYALAGAAFISLFAFKVPFPLIVLAAGLVGWARSRWAGEVRQLPHQPEAVARQQPAPSSLALMRTLLVWGGLWAMPLLGLLLLAGTDSTLLEVGTFFSKAAMVTFGGAYAVLAYIAQQGVEVHGWLQPGEMADALALAETTPGPLILVTQFVGFLAAYRDPGVLSPMLAGILGGLLTVWVTFVPCFLWIFLGAPYIESLQHNRSLASALSAITAAVAGVILNLAVWFALQTLFREHQPVHWGIVALELPVPRSLDIAALLLSIGAMLAMLRFHAGILLTLSACAVVGVVLQWV